MNFKALHNQLQALQRKLPKPEKNCLTDPEWPQLRGVLLRETQPWPDAYRAIHDAISYLDGLEYAVWRQYPLPIGIVSLYQVLYDALQPFMDARVAVAEALMQLSKHG